MSRHTHFELPADKRSLQRRATRLEWLTIAYLVSAVVLLFLTLGSSQAMKAAWIEDILSLAPPAAFLIAARVRTRPPNDRFPWGYHRSVSIAYLTAALALLVLGSYILFDSLLKLVTAEHPPIGVVELFGQQVWLGWLMIGALVYSGIPAVFLGRAKMPLAEGLHDKVLYADAQMNKADWMTAGAAVVGILGIGLGLWWADAVAATVISLDIVHDGYVNLRTAVHDLMDSRPTRYDHSAPHPLVGEAEAELRKMDWVAGALVRLREEGHVFTGRAFVVPRTGEDLVARAEGAARHLMSLDWRLHDIVVVPVSEIREATAEAEAAVAQTDAAGHERAS